MPGGGVGGEEGGEGGDDRGEDRFARFGGVSPSRRGIAPAPSPALSGARSRLMPMPTPIRWSPVVGSAPRCSQRIPATLRLSMRTSFGHLRIGEGPRASRASATAIPARSGVHERWCSGVSTRIAVRIEEEASSHRRPERPRPAVWWSTRIVVKGASPSSASARARTARAESTSPKRRSAKRAGESGAVFIGSHPGARRGGARIRFRIFGGILRKSSVFELPRNLKG